jgi:hypothetical protein
MWVVTMSMKSISCDVTPCSPVEVTDISEKVLSRFRGGYRRVIACWMGLLTTYTHHSELHALNNSVACLHTLQSITAPTKFFPTCCVFTSPSLSTVSNNGDSSASPAQFLFSQPPVQISTITWQLTTNWVARIVFKITPRHGPHRKHSRFHCRSPTAAAA